jgi:uncharacterized protein
VFIGLQELELRAVRFNVDLSPGKIDFESKITQASVLHAEGSARLLNRSVGEIRVEGTLRVDVEGICDRCVEPAIYAVENRFDLVYMPSAKDSAGGEREIDQAAVEVGFYEGSGLELNDILREVVLLALPMQMVCREDCKGICPTCGQNRNQQDCGCHPELADDRWSKLKALRAEIGPQN